MKIFLARIALVVASFALVLLAAEGVARVIISRRPPPMPPRIPKEWQELPRIKSVHALSKPNVRALHARVLFETNSAGFRGPDRTPQKPPGVFRIVVIGDSVAMGWGVLYDHTYAARLERALNAHPGSQTVQVLDIALAGLNTYTAVGRLISVGLSYEPDLVIYGFTLNDIENKHYRRSVDVDSRLLSETYESPSRLWRLIGRRGISLWYAIFAPRGSYVYECEDNYFDNPAAWELMLGHLNALAEVTGKHDLCTVLLVHSRLSVLNFLHPFRREYVAVGEAAEAHGLYVAQSFPSFAGKTDADLWVSPTDSHPNAEAHGILTDVLLRRLETLPGSCWERPPPPGDSTR